MNYLVGDIGNTSTKICLINKNSKIINQYSIETKNLFLKNNIYKFFYPVIKKKLKKKILFSSVVPKVYNEIKKFLSIKNFKCLEIKNLDLKKDVTTMIKFLHLLYYLILTPDLFP